jgi:uncharacterized membrane protein
MQKLWDTLLCTKNFIKGLLSEPDGTPSCARLLMCVFSLATIRLMFVVTRHLLEQKDATVISIWLANVPLIIGALVALITAPYVVNKGTSTFTDLAGMITSRRQQVAGAIEEKVMPAVGKIADKG